MWNVYVVSVVWILLNRIFHKAGYEIRTNAVGDIKKQLNKTDGFSGNIIKQSRYQPATILGGGSGRGGGSGGDGSCGGGGRGGIYYYRGFYGNAGSIWLCTSAAAGIAGPFFSTLLLPPKRFLRKGRSYRGRNNTIQRGARESTPPPPPSMNDETEMKIPNII